MYTITREYENSKWNGKYNIFRTVINNNTIKNVLLVKHLSFGDGYFYMQKGIANRPVYDKSGDFRRYQEYGKIRVPSRATLS